MKKRKFFKIETHYILLLVIVLQLLLLTLLEIFPIYQLHVDTIALKNTFESENFSNWKSSYLRSGLGSGNESTLEILLEEYIKTAEDFNQKSIFDIEVMEIGKPENLKKDIDFEVKETRDENIREDIKIVLKKGQNGILNQKYINVANHLILLDEYIEKQPKTQEVVVGSLSTEEFADKIKAVMNNAQYEIGEVKSVTNKNNIIASATIKNKICNSTFDQDISYDPQEKALSLPDFSNTSSVNCFTARYQPPKEIQKLSCNNCMYAPVDKSHTLPSNYVPSVVAISLPGGGFVTPETNQWLIKMSEAAKKAGTDIVITSAYRSYVTQQLTFNSWVAREQAKGKSYANAVVSANTYSAFPGQSEHQLGTTMDVRCSGCDSFSRGLNPLYRFLEQNAHKYGFVISYPNGKQHLTGYTYEPWHIRYIGVGLATELYNKGYLNPSNNEYLSAFLIQKNLYK